MKYLVLLISLSCALSCAAQSDFVVTRDTLGKFYLIQNGVKTEFDTVYVANTLKAKVDEEQSIQVEIDLLERLVVLRRSLAIVRDERRTLSEILNKTKCVK